MESHRKSSTIVGYHRESSKIMIFQKIKIFKILIIFRSAETWKNQSNRFLCSLAEPGSTREHLPRLPSTAWQLRADTQCEGLWVARCWRYQGLYIWNHAKSWKSRFAKVPELGEQPCALLRGFKLRNCETILKLQNTAEGVIRYQPIEWIVDRMYGVISTKAKLMCMTHTRLFIWQDQDRISTSWRSANRKMQLWTSCGPVQRLSSGRTDLYGGIIIRIL